MSYNGSGFLWSLKKNLLCILRITIILLRYKTSRCLSEQLSGCYTIRQCSWIPVIFIMIFYYIHKGNTVNAIIKSSFSFIFPHWNPIHIPYSLIFYVVSVSLHERCLLYQYNDKTFFQLLNKNEHPVTLFTDFYIAWSKRTKCNSWRYTMPSFHFQTGR